MGGGSAAIWFSLSSLRFLQCSQYGLVNDAAAKRMPFGDKLAKCRPAEKVGGGEGGKTEKIEPQRRKERQDKIGREKLNIHGKPFGW